MTRITAREILDAAMTLNEGERIITKCSDYKEMESLRTNLYKARRTLLRTHRSLAYSLYISRERTDDSYLVVVTKELSVSNVVIIDKDGNVKPFERTEVSLIEGEDEQERMIRLMRQDGLSEEEISDALHKKAEDDFDEAASEIEASQGLKQKKAKKRQ